MINKIAISLVLMILAIGIASATMTGNEQMTRTVSSTTVNPGQTFTVTYTVSQATPPWGVSIVDGVSGGCQFPAGNSYRSVMLSDEGNTKTVQVTAPQSGSCTFTGDYSFTGIINFPNIIVNINGSTVNQTTNCTTGATQACTASNSCTGSQTCSNGVWSSCSTSLIKCSDGTCKADCGTTSCSNGENRTCSSGNCTGSQTCSNGVWSSCSCNGNQSFEICSIAEKIAFFDIPGVENKCLEGFIIVIAIFILIMLLK